MMTDAFVIAVDGPGGAGKGELTRRLAMRLGFALLDSGAIYRVLAYAARKAGLALFDEDSLVEEAKVLNLSFEAQDDGVHVMLNGEDVSSEIRSERTAEGASRVAALPRVREALLQRQRDFCMPPGLVADGRDMGTVVFPKADLKIFLDASPEERARRRVLQLTQAGREAVFELVLKEIEERDARDRNRPVAPLKPAEDAVLIDSTHLNIDEVLEKALELVRSKGIKV
ncbi:MAG TPA: (d)CMP kinase [Candidatus Avisuccinivibrio pullicola]|nr:(d)CMP kinase [Candidatus Avisuccinivibrio pullicola]